MRGILLTVIALLLSISVPSWAATCHVAPPPEGNDANPGTEEQPFATIQKGIDSAVDGDTVIVAEGTYVENIHFNGKNIVLRSTDPTDADVVENTIADGNHAGSVITFDGTENESCVLGGFTIRNGAVDYDRGRDGGGICGGTSAIHTHAVVENNIIAGNWCYSGGGGGGVAFCDGTIQNNLIFGNLAEGYGGGLYYCWGTIRNNLVCQNVGSKDGGGLCTCNGPVLNNTIVGNYPYGLWYCKGTILNCIIWGNTVSQVSLGNAPSFSCIQEAAPGGEGNIVNNPRFVDAPLGDYRLRPDSPCIDAGAYSDWMLDALDLDGNPRIVGARVDMGSYEWKTSISRVLLLPGGKAELTWVSRPSGTYAVWSRLDLADGTWMIEQGSIVPQGTTTSWTDTSPLGEKKFYRIEMK